MNLAGDLANRHPPDPPVLWFLQCRQGSLCPVAIHPGEAWPTPSLCVSALTVSWFLDGNSKAPPPGSWQGWCQWWVRCLQVGILSVPAWGGGIWKMCPSVLELPASWVLALSGQPCPGEHCRTQSEKGDIAFSPCPIEDPKNSLFQRCQTQHGKRGAPSTPEFQVNAS